MLIVDYEKEMRAKIVECDEWLTGKEKAVEKVATEEANVALAKEALAKAEQILEDARQGVAEYTAENIINVENYKAGLKAKLGIID